MVVYCGLDIVAGRRRRRRFGCMCRPSEAEAQACGDCRCQKNSFDIHFPHFVNPYDFDGGLSVVGIFGAILAVYELTAMMHAGKWCGLPFFITSNCLADQVKSLLRNLFLGNIVAKQILSFEVGELCRSVALE